MLYEQYLVSVHKIGLSNAIEWLEEHGYRNVCNLHAGRYKLSVLVVEKDYFFGTSVSCMAAACVSGQRTIDFEKFIRCHSHPIKGL